MDGVRPRARQAARAGHGVVARRVFRLTRERAGAGRAGGHPATGRDGRRTGGRWSRRWTCDAWDHSPKGNRPGRFLDACLLPRAGPSGSAHVAGASGRTWHPACDAPPRGSGHPHRAAGGASGAGVSKPATGSGPVCRQVFGLRGRELTLIYFASLPGCCDPVLGRCPEAFRFRLPLRGSSGFAPDSLFRPIHPWRGRAPTYTTYGVFLLPSTQNMLVAGYQGVGCPCRPGAGCCARNPELRRMPMTPAGTESGMLAPASGVAGNRDETGSRYAFAPSRHCPRNGRRKASEACTERIMATGAPRREGIRSRAHGPFRESGDRPG